MSWYKIGTVTVTNGSPTITGAGGTLWVDAGTLNAGDIILLPDGNLYEIQSINSNTGITLASNYLGGSLSGQAYAIMPIGLLPSALAQQVKSVLTTANTALASAVRFDTAAQGLTSGQQQNARTNIAALGAADVGKGRLSKPVAGGADVELTATEAANQFIELTGALTGNINVIVPAAARLFMIYNATSGAYALTVKTAAGTGVAVPQGARVILECDGTNVLNPLNAVPGILTLTSSGGAGMRVYGGSGGHQWDIYLSGNNLRMSDNTGGGVFTVDQAVSFGSDIAHAGKCSSDTSTSFGSALSATGKRSFANTTYGAVLMGYGTTADVLLAQRSGGAALQVDAGTPNISLYGHLTMPSNGVITMSGPAGQLVLSASSTPSLTFNTDTDTGFGWIQANVFGTYTAGVERGRVTASGYTKQSVDGTYLSATGNYHELRGNENGGYAVMVSHVHGTNPYGVAVQFTATTPPNGTANYFFVGFDSGGDRFIARSNGGLANYSAYNVNLSDERLKSNLTPRASSAWGAARTLSDLIEEGEYSAAPGRRLWMMRAQRVEQVGFAHLVDRNVRAGLALMRGLHEQQIDQVFRAATGELLTWADEEAKPALASLGQRVARIEQQLNNT